MKMNAIQLLNYNRFDIAAKHLYARYRENNYDTSFGKDVYKNHLGVWNNFNEIDNPNKNCYEDFECEFHNILDSIKEKGFDSSLETLPVTNTMCLLNGSHRVAASILYDKEVECHITESLEEGQLECSSHYFRSKGLSSPYLDSIALEYASLDVDTKVITIFPTGTVQNKMGEVLNILEKSCDIIHAKQFPHGNIGPLNVIRQLYLGEDWGLGWNENFAGFARKAELCFTNNSPIVTFLVKISDSNNPVELKEEIRSIFGCGKHSCHINDTHEETMRIVRVFFNDNSIHHLNNSNYIYYPNFQNQFEYYKRYISDNNLDPEKYCITASSVLSIYGLREGQDLDYLHSGDEIYGHADIHSHNQEIHNYTKTKDDIIYNPNNHFWYDGVKVASLSVIRELKEKRNEPKDIKDVELVESVI
jgi:hypothetical protein